MTVDNISVLVACDSNTVGLILPTSSSYDNLISLLAMELDISEDTDELEISYDVGGNMQPVRIMNDRALQFYIQLKQSETALTAYTLRVAVNKSSTSHRSGTYLPDENDNVAICEVIEPALPPASLIINSVDVPTMHEFVTTVDINVDPPLEYERDDMSDVVTQIGTDFVDVDQFYRDKCLLKDSLAMYAIQNNFEFIVYKSNHREYVLKCKSQGCSWRFRASKVGQTDLFKVRYIRNGHSCTLDSAIRDHTQAKSALIGEVIKHKYTSAKTVYTPIDIINDMSSTYGLTLRYGKAWRAREHALEKIMGDPCDAYSKLPIYFSEVEEKNPGSKTGIEIESDGHFKYAFMALGASIMGWKYCKPVVVIDATFLTGRYGGSLLTACTQDSNNAIYILAFGVGDSENNDSWVWFLRRFKEAYGERDGLCIISDRHGSIEHAVKEVYPGVMHGYCAQHILQNLRTSYTKCGKNIAKAFNSAARAYTAHEFEYHMKQLDQINNNIRNDLDAVGFHKWSRSHAPTNRFSVMTSNIVESVNAAIKPFKHCPIDYLFESLRHTIQSWVSKNRATAHGIFTRLATYQESLLRSNAKKSLKFKVSASNDALYQVSSHKTQYVVDLKKMTCTCNRFQIDGLPCPHALAVIGSRGEQQYNYYSSYNSKEYYMAVYGGCVVPLGDREQWKVDKCRVHDEILPPKSKRQAGRPKITRRRTRMECLNPTVCGRCGSRGHNRRSCKQPLALCQIRKRKRGLAV